MDQDGKRLKQQKAALRSQAGGGVSGALQGAAQERGGGVHLQLVLAGGRAAGARAIRWCWPIRRGSSNTAASNMRMTRTTRFFWPSCSGWTFCPPVISTMPKLRPVRDLLRRRLSLVHQRTALMLSFKSLLHAHDRRADESEPAQRHGGQGGASALRASGQSTDRRDADRAHRTTGRRASSGSEKAVLSVARELPCYAKLKTLPGVGMILGMTITMEVGDIKRFAGPGNFASYCRTVEAKRTTNGKNKGREQPQMRQQISGAGRLWRRPISPGATMSRAASGMTARRPGPAR